MRKAKCIACIIFSFAFLLQSLTLSGKAEFKVYRSVSTQKKQVALTFDDGPHPSLTPQILEILARHDIPATFFMVGQNVINYPTAAKAVIDAGHEIGNHTFTHPHLAAMDESSIMQEIDKCEEALEELCECRPHLLRTPQGVLTPSLERCLRNADYILVLWSLDTRDWDNKSTACIVQTVLDNVKAGDIVLMHDYVSYNSRTPEALEAVIPALLSQGYEFVTVSELLGIR